MLFGFEALVSVYGSARQAEAELTHPLVWELIQTIVAERFPDRPEMLLPAEPMKRHHYIYGRNRYLTDRRVTAGLLELHRRLLPSRRGNSVSSILKVPARGPIQI
jgi:hypothetical protein